MPRRGNTNRQHRNKHQGHRMHRKPRVARIKARAGSGRLQAPTGWSPSMRYDDSLGKWVLR